MRRFSIGKAMLVVALVAANLVVIRECGTFSLHGAEDEQEIILSFLPLLDALIVAAAVIVSRYRVRLRWRPRSNRGAFAAAFVLVSGFMLIVAMAVCLADSSYLIDYLEWGANPIAGFLEPLGVSAFEDSSFDRFVMLPLILWTLVSLPLGMAAMILTAVVCRVRLVVTPREVAPCDGLQSPV